MGKLNQNKALILIVLLGFGIRFLGIFDGYPQGWHPDEWRIVLESLSMAQSKSLIAPNVNYPLLYKYLVISVYGIWYLIGRIIGLFSNSLDFANLFFTKHQLFLIVPRLINVILGTITIIVGYRVGEKIFNKRTAIIAALFIALEHQLITHSQVGLHQTIAALSTLPVFYCINSTINKPDKKNYFILGISLGLAASAHHTTILFLPTIAFVFLSEIKKNSPFSYKKVYLFLVATIMATIIGNINWIVKPKESLDFIFLGQGVSKTAFSSIAAFRYTIIDFIAWFSREIVYQDAFIGVMIIAGILIAILKKNKQSTAYIIFLGTYTLFFYNWAYRWLHVMITVIPIGLIFAANAVDYTFERLKIRNSYTLFFITIILVFPNIVSAVKTINEKSKIDTRNIAQEWVYQNIPNGSSIAIDWSAYNLILNSIPPVYLLNSTGEDYFNTAVPNQIKAALEEKTPKYEIIAAMYNSKHPIWPKEFSPDEIVTLTQKSPIYTNLYSYFNFLSHSKVAEKAEYLIISSYTYSMFLDNEDPDKRDIFNPYIKDNMSLYHNHTGKYVNDNRHGPLYFLAKRGQQFYKPLLSGSHDQFQEIIRFQPSNEYTGPTIIIYKTNQTSP